MYMHSQRHAAQMQCIVPPSRLLPPPEPARPLTTTAFRQVGYKG